MGRVHFPSFLEGLSLRRRGRRDYLWLSAHFPTFFVGTFIKALRVAHPCLRRKHLNLPYGFVGTFPNLFLLRSWTHHSPGTELFLFTAQEAPRPKHRPQTPPTSCYLPPPGPQSEELNTPTLRHKLADKPKHPTVVLPSKPSSQS